MKTRDSELLVATPSKVAARRLLKIAGGTAVLAMVVWTAIAAKEARHAPALVDVRQVQTPVQSTPLSNSDEPQGGPIAVDEPAELSASNSPAAAPSDTSKLSPEVLKFATDPSVRWFNGRPVRPARTMTMTVTAYSPDWRSCGESADGLTATLHSVETNLYHLVAADPTLLPYGSLLSLDDYAGGQVVPVLDCGGAIKGRHIDLLFPTDEEAREWGVKKLKITIWKYIDGAPAGNPRKLR